MELVVKLLQFFGYNSGTTGDRVWRAKTFVAVTLLWAVVPGFVFIFRHSSDVSSAMKAFAENVLVAKVVLHAGKMIRGRVELEKTHNVLEEALVRTARNSNDEIRRKFAATERWLRLISIGYVGFEALSVVGYILLPVVVFLIRYLVADEEDLAFPNTSLEADFYFFDYKSSFELWLSVNLLSSTVDASVFITGASLDCFSWGLLYRTTELFQIVAMKMRCLSGIKEIDKYRSEMKDLLRLQEIANRSAIQIEKFLSEVLLYLFVVCICVLCAIMLVLSMPNKDHQLLLSMSIALNFALFQIFSYSMLGTELITASTSMADAIFETNWYNRTCSEQRNDLFILMRSQKMVTFTAGKFVTVNRATFGAVLKSAFSYYSVLRQLYNE